MATKPTYRYRAPKEGRHRGVMSVVLDSRGRLYVRKWQRKGRPNPSTAELETRAQFKQAVQNIKNVAPAVQDYAREISANTAWTWRDLLMAWQYGHNVTIYTPDGTTFVGLKDMAIDAQSTLDSIVDDVGAILVRTPTGWKGLIPGPIGEVLMSLGPGAPPDFHPLPAGGTSASGVSILGLDHYKGEAGGYSWGANEIFCRPMALPATPALKGIAFGMGLASATINYYGALYDYSTHTPTTLIATTPMHTGVVAGLNAARFTAPVILPSDGLYGLAISWDAPVQWPIVAYGTPLRYAPLTGAPPDPFPASSYNGSWGYTAIGALY